MNVCKKIWEKLGRLGFLDWIPDKLYLQVTFYFAFGYKLNLKNPRTFNEKLQWLKLYDRKPEYTMMVDKYQVRQHIANSIGEQYLIPLIGVWNDPSEIDFNQLPSQFVLKCNHNSGLGMCICSDKKKLEVEHVKAELYKGIKQDYYKTNREWPYKNVPRKIICEKFMTDESGNGLKDYKIWCFNGNPKITLVCSERFSGKGLHEDFFDMEWNHISVKRPESPNAESAIQKPRNYTLMQELAKELSSGIPFVRIDFYEISGKIYFGEMTFFPASGFEKFEPESYDFDFGEMLFLS